MHWPPILELLQNSCDPPLTPESLEELELALGVRLPTDYAQFLLQFNGGNFCRTVEFSLPDPNPFLDRASLDLFYGEPADGIEHNGLVWHAEILNDRIPADFLPI